ncbi:MAG: hypothetical protein ACXIUM_03630 [Wenzhouxiangella sp.]
MDLLDRYLAAVEQELPADKRKEVSRELRANILDQLDALRETSPQQSDAMLLHGALAELGPPRLMAHRFDPPKPLIRDDHLPIYRYTLFVVFGILFVIQVVSVSLLWLGNEHMGLLLMGKAMAGGFIGDASFAFTVISLAFWLMGREQDSGPERSKSWDPATLPHLTRSWQRIDFSDIFTDLATYLFLLIVIWYPGWAGIPTADLLTESGRTLLQILSVLPALGLVVCAWQLRQRIWTPSLLKSNLLLNALMAIAILVLAFSGPLLAHVPERLQWMTPEQLGRSITATLLIIALFPGWEAVRDWRRLRELNG